VAQRNGQLERIPDLPPIPRGSRALMLPVVAARKGQQVVRLEADLDLGGAVVALDAAEDALPDVDRLLEVDGRVGEGDVDARLEGFINDADAVGGEEEDAGVVFELAEED
jgi:hypothetical protein